VIDYVPGKLAWFEENQPREGKAVEETWIGDVADPEVPTCGLKDRVGDVRGRTRVGTPASSLSPSAWCWGCCARRSSRVTPTRPPSA